MLNQVLILATYKPDYDFATYGKINRSGVFRFRKLAFSDFWKRLRSQL